MDNFIHVPSWSRHFAYNASSSRPLTGHFRSRSSLATSTSLPASTNNKPYPALKSPKSTSQLASASLSLSFPFSDDDEMSTLPDPRSRGPTNAHDHKSSDEDPPIHHPDLSDEIATLSTKLINAINHQTVLGDTLSATRHELVTARARIQELQDQLESHRKILSGDVWVRKSSVEAEKRALNMKYDSEIVKRQDTEASKKKMEQEVETLTTALFEEANKMVILAKEEAKKQQDIAQRKNDLLKARLQESEILLKTQQTQLAELKRVMGLMASQQDDQQQTNTPAPSSPGLPRLDTSSATPLLHAPLSAAASPLPDCFAPGPPTSLHHLILPILRHDLGAYDDFITLVHQAHKHAADNRVSSGSLTGGLNALGLGVASSTSANVVLNVSTSSLSKSASAGSAPSSPNTPISSTQSTPNRKPASSNLKETKFYKRILVEDIEPTLRLDAAPGLSWLARRSVLTAITEGTLFVEPVPSNVSGEQPNAKPQLLPCTLCGESRNDNRYLRHHRFRTSDAKSAQRYALCNYCLGRVRSTGDFVGFLRMVKDGLWRADNEDHEKTAWEESVRLREQMFWSRIGGGVVPASQPDTPTDDEARPSVDEVLKGTLSGPVMASVNGQPTIVERGTDAGDAVFDRKALLIEPRTPPGQSGEQFHASSLELRKDATFQKTSTQQPVILED